MVATIATWMSLIQPIFTQPTTRVFVRLLSGWILCTGRRTVNGMLRWADPDGIRAYDAYHRFYPDAAWGMDELWRVLTRLLFDGGDSRPSG